MSQQIELSAEPRSDVGKGASRRLRRHARMVPGIVYGGGEAPVNVALVENSLARAIQNDTFFSQILSLQVGASKSQVIARDLQRHPASNKPIHIDFQRVVADQEITVEIPIHFINEAECIGVKEQKGMITHHVIEVEVTCLPASLPNFIEVDVKPLQLGQSIHLSDLKLPEGVELEALVGLSDEEREEQDVPVVSVQASTLAAEMEADEAAGAEGAEVPEAAAESTQPTEAGEANKG
jgi:large subunit ribosomal protein L25